MALSQQTQDIEQLLVHPLRPNIKTIAVQLFVLAGMLISRVNLLKFSTT